MCNLSKACAFNRTYNKNPNNNVLHQLLIETYCEGDLHEVCRRKGFEKDMGSTPLADLGPNGYNVDSNQRMY